MSPDGDARPGVERVLDELRSAGPGITAGELAARVGLHVTTVRFHLDRLVAQGRAVGHRAPTGGRGRPGIAYRAVPVADARSGMIAALAQAATALDGDVVARAQRAGEAWAASLDLGAAPVEPAITEVFARLGFAPTPVEGGLALRACPFLDEARRHPEVVCEVHRGLAAGIARRTGGEAVLRPFEQRGCLLDLREG